MNNKKPMHGTSKTIGCSHLSLGNFRELFPEANTWVYDFNPQDLERVETTEPHERCPSEVVAEQHAAEQVAIALGGVNGVMHDVNNSSKNSDIPAAYTFFAQFVDHDITLDASSDLHGKALTSEKIKDLPNLRSASLDLDSVYGFGPDVSPYLYDPSQFGRLLVGSKVDGIANPNDVPRRSDGRALLGDSRNDENLFLSQLHLLFLRLHNRLLIKHSFEKAQQEARYHYQAIVLYDFLKRICHEKVYEFALGKIEKNAKKFSEKTVHESRTNLLSDGNVRRRAKASEEDYPFYAGNLVSNRVQFGLPVEFSAAAYRFGHSMVRSHYPVNESYPSIEIFDERFGTLGFSQVPPELTVDWRFLLDVEPGHPYANSKALDHLLADELIRLPDPVVGRNAPTNDRALAFRNLLRGYVLGLPSGQSVAETIGKKYKLTESEQNLQFGNIPGWVGLDKELRCKLEKHTPLFFYLMREAGIHGNNSKGGNDCENQKASCESQNSSGGNHLGPVGTAILMEVFGTMLVYCDTFLRVKGGWTPDPDIIQECKKVTEITLADLVRYVSS